MVKSFFFLSIFIFAASAAFSQGLEETDTLKTKELQEMVVSATRQEENLLQAPVSIEKMNLQYIRQSAQPGFFDAIQNMKGIQVLTPSLGFKVINARGFAHTTNVRFVQMVDGVDNQAPHIGAPIGNSLGPNDLDILNVEVVPGSASAMFGMNAINGIANFMTKNPFEFEGFSFNQKVGVNNINSPDTGSSILSESNLRFAKVISSKWAMKINGTVLKGTDWIANNRTDLNPAANLSSGLEGSSNPGKDLVNIYGDESANRRTLTLDNIQYVVSRTGYAEKEVSDYGLQNIKGDVSLFFRPATEMEMSYTYRAAVQDNIYQRTNRFRFDNYFTQQHAFTFQSPTIQSRTYLTLENTGDSYNIRSMAENVDRGFKSDNDWFRDFSTQFDQSINEGKPVAEAMDLGRAFADRGRVQPNSMEMANRINDLREINNWDIGAALKVKAKMFHSEFQQDISDLFTKGKNGVRVMYGLDYRQYIIVPDGNYFINPVEPDANLNYWKVGGFVQGTKTFFDSKLKVNTVIRIEKNQYFPVNFNPRLAIVYSPEKDHNFRFSIQNGYRFPSIFEAFSNINSGGRRRVGGLPVMSQGVFERSYTQASITRFQRAVQKDVNADGIPVDESIIKNQSLLSQNPYTYLEPEQVTSFEAGYRSTFLEGRINLDVDFYYNIYRNLIAQIDANVPKTENQDSIPFYLQQNSKQDFYRLWTNSKTVSNNYGATIGLNYAFLKKLNVGGNFTYAKLASQSQSDGLEDGFNTPRWIYNLYLSSPEIYKSLGFNINFRQQSEFLWQSALATGMVAQYATLDFQVNATFFRNSLNVKIGATNMLNRYYYSFIGGPAIGGFYYTSLTFGF